MSGVPEERPALVAALAEAGIALARASREQRPYAITALFAARAALELHDRMKLIADDRWFSARMQELRRASLWRVGKKE